MFSSIKLAWQTCREKRSIRDKNQIFHSVRNPYYILSIIVPYSFIALYRENKYTHVAQFIMCMCTCVLFCCFYIKLHQNKTHSNLNRKKLHVVAIKVMRVTITRKKKKMRWHTEDWIPFFCRIHKSYNIICIYAYTNRAKYHCK